MPFHYLRRLGGHKRDQQADQHLGYALALIAGAINAGGFLAIGKYTSHTSGMISTVADELVLGQFWLAAAALLSVLAFLCGAISSTILINWARNRHLRSEYALSLLFEAMLLLGFGLAGAFLSRQYELLVPITLLLLCYIMGLQNAIITKISGSVIRTTHMTGIVTDIGIELGKSLYINRGQHQPVCANRQKLRLHLSLLGCFLAGGILGANGFKAIGYYATIPLAIWLCILAMMPIWADMKVQWRLLQHREFGRKPNVNRP
jgi:uncharacterized membrane protein YoaK (UPF0700 family)